MDPLPTLDSGQERIGYNGTAPEYLNHAPVFARPVIRVSLPWKLKAVTAAPPPFNVSGIKPRLVAFGLERPILEGVHWTLDWRGYGQVGSVKGAFTCPHSVLAFSAGSPDNPTACVAESADVATLRYAGMEIEIAHPLARMPRLIPHAAAGGNFIDGVFQVHASVEEGLDQTRLWARGGTVSIIGGDSYLMTSRVEFTIDAFYSPPWVRRHTGAPRINDGLLYLRALLSYTFR